jgi:FtsH-binding integral membrane protein
MLVPVLVFLGMCARISAAQRDRRLAAVRLAGATPSQVRLLAAAETALPAAVGAVVGLLVVAVGKGVLERRYLQTEAGLGLARALPTDVPLPPVRSVLVLLLVPALCAASALLALRRVEATPLGVSRRAQPAPRAGGFAVLLVGLALVPVTTLVNGGFVLLPIAVVLTMLGVTAAASWLTARVGTLAARRARRPALLLAGRRLQADPRAQGRALSGVVLAVLVAGAAAVPRAATLQDRDEAFFRNAYALVDLALLVALVVAAAGLLVASCEAVLERRRTLASLAAAGVPLGTLRRAVLLQSLLPAVPAVALALVVGVGFTLAPAVLGFAPIPWARLLGVLVLALLAVTAASAATLPLLRRAVRPSELRQT